MKATLTMRHYSQRTIEIGDCISDAYKRIPKRSGTRNAAPSGSQWSVNQTTQPSPSVESGSPKAHGAPDDPADGSVSGNTYASNFFHFSLSFPKGWLVLSRGSGPQVDAAGAISDVLLLAGSPDKEMRP